MGVGSGKDPGGKVITDQERKQPEREGSLPNCGLGVEELTLDSPMVDALAFRAPVHASSRRRTAILIWGIGYLGTGREFLMLALRRHSICEAVIAALLFAVGARVVLNSTLADGGPASL